jgi:hypothetical protein
MHEKVGVGMVKNGVLDPLQLAVGDICRSEVWRVKCAGRMLKLIFKTNIAKGWGYCG